ncbi:MAG: hypothetical protein PHE17_08995 [Thiothrix sp.]|uniref:hypothetical protein n=1 Tax=Thiothrix sp. TaxID=1032 RepID=UPI002636BE38|nr:hypothetical protein [Thiothrix sp.]MDD5393140.1 hypothetical protein [Thiothrix sp.]
MTTNNHGGARPGAGRKLIERLTLQIDLGKGTPSGNLDNMGFADLHGKRRQHQDALVVANRCKQMLLDIGLSENQQLNDMVQGFQREIADLTAEINARNASAAPYLRAAFSREFELNALISQARNRIKNGQADAERKRAELTKAGVDGADTLIEDYDASSDLAEIKELEAEAAKWAQFQQTELVRDLPPNAAESVARIGVYSSVKESFGIPL